MLHPNVFEHLGLIQQVHRVSGYTRRVIPARLLSYRVAPRMPESQPRCDKVQRGGTAGAHAPAVTSRSKGASEMESEILPAISGDRQRLDAIARAIVTGERGLGTVDDAIADDLASIMTDRLRAAGVTGYHRVADVPDDAAARWQRVQQRYGRAFVHTLIRRTDKHLGSAAMLTYTGGGS